MKLLNLKYQNIFFIVTLFSIINMGCALKPAAEVYQNGSSPDAGVPEYRIGIDDSIRVDIWRNPDLSTLVPVRPDGKITVPLIGEVHAAGLTPIEVAKDISIKLGSFIRDPNVTVAVMGLHSHEYLTRVRVTGAVNQPISINYRQGMTVLDAVLAAGGLNDFASANSTKLYRKVNNKSEVIKIPLDSILHEGELSSNIELRPGDVITVPERIF